MGDRGKELTQYIDALIWRIEQKRSVTEKDQVIILIDSLQVFAAGSSLRSRLRIAWRVIRF